MLKLVIIASTLIMCCQCGGGGGYGGSSGGSGGYLGGAAVVQSTGGTKGGGGYSGGHQGGGETVQAAIHTKHQIEFRDVPSSGQVQPTTIEVGSSSIPLNILFRSSSSNLNVQQAHQGGQGDTQRTSSQDEPHHLMHEVTKPIIQEVREVITPFRRIVQEIQPVQEEIQTIVARSQNQQQQRNVLANNNNNQANFQSNNQATIQNNNNQGAGIIGSTGFSAGGAVRTNGGAHNYGGGQKRTY